MLARTTLASKPILWKLSVIAGKIRWRIPPRPEAGNHLNQEAKMSINMIPIQKLGVDIVNRAIKLPR
jgi:hypothetical protein